MRTVDGTVIALDPMPHRDGTVVTTDRGPAAGLRVMPVNTANIEAEPAAARRDRFRRHDATCKKMPHNGQAAERSSSGEDGAS